MKKMLVLVSMLMLSCATAFAQAGEVSGSGAEQITMRMHHLHLRMNHGLSVAVQGSNMAMISLMGMSPHSDAESLRDGLSMMKQGRAMVEQAATGPEMQELGSEGAAASPLMSYTHGLNRAMLNLLVQLEAMSQAAVSIGDGMSMHHIHMLVNHATLMALEGARLMMLGQMGMSGNLDALAEKHGRKMISGARNLWHEAVEGRVMKSLDKQEAGRPAVMAATHRHAEAAKQLMDLLLRMDAQQQQGRAGR